MIEQHLHDIETVLLQYGFVMKTVSDKKSPVPNVAYYREFDTKVGNIVVFIPKGGLSLLGPPVVGVYRCPDSLKHARLPHLMSNGSLCLFDKNTHLLDPLNPRAFYAAVAKKIEKIIELWESGNFEDEFAHEFSGYWSADAVCFQVGGETRHGMKLFKYNWTDCTNKTFQELVLADDLPQVKDWVLRRGGSNADKVEFVANTLVVEMSRPLQVDFSRKWPPEDMKSLLEWLQWADPPALASFLSKMRNNNLSKRFSALFRYETEMVMVRFKLEPSASKVLKRGAGRRRGARVSQAELITALGRKGAVSNFTRLWVELANQQYLVGRNAAQIQAPLSGQRIALIGCGTVGSHTAKPIVQAGAGIGGGELVLFDSDTFGLRAGNLGRHALGMRYLTVPKSDAVKRDLDEQGYGANVKAERGFKLQHIEQDWDVIIDATGDRAFSLSLARWFRHRANANPATLVHGWVAGFGHVVRALRDDGKQACYACQYVYREVMAKPRHPTFASGKAPKEPFRRSCGENHLPYGTELSLAAASMILQLVTRSGTGPNYLQRTMSTQAINLKDMSLSQRDDCPACRG